MAKLCSAYFSASGSWTAPAGVTRVQVLAHGGGAGGNGGRGGLTGDQSLSSGATVPYMVQVTVVPNTTYTITIGAGGNGGGPRSSGTANASVGGDTTFGALWTFRGGINDPGYYSSASGPDGSIDIGHVAARSNYGYQVHSGFVAGETTLGTASGSYKGGQKGPPGYSGSTGGAGGIANSAGAGGDGGDATGFGAAGGAGGNGSTSGGSGGDGAPGQLWVIWVE